MRLKRGLEKAVAVALVLTFLIIGVNAGVYLSQPKLIYNSGDFVELNVTVDPVQDGPLKIRLFCDENSKEIYSGPPIDSISIPMSSLWIDNLGGECYFSTTYAGEVKNSNSKFKISKELIISLLIESFFGKPGDEIAVSGSVKRLNGEGSDGEVEVIIPFAGAVGKSLEPDIESGSPVNNDSVSQNSSENATQTVPATNPITSVPGQNFYGKASDGEFSISFYLPDNIAAGDYKININAYEKTSLGEKTNEGKAIAYLKVSQIAKSIEFALSNQNFNPGESLSIKPNILDQTGNSINEQTSLVVSDSERNRVFEKIVKSGETVEWLIPTDAKSGYYSARASGAELNITKNFFINEKAIASFELVNSTLIIKSIGNIPYKKDVQVEINGKPFVKSVDLKPGESTEFKLTGIEGDYDIKVSDGEKEIKQAGVHLTGKAIGVSDTNEKGISGVIFTPWLWAFLIIFLLVAVLLLFSRVVKKKSIAYPLSNKKGLKLDGVVVDKKKMQNEKEAIKPNAKPALFLKKTVVPTIAQQAMVTGGSRNSATILAVKIKDKIDHSSKESVEKAVECVYSKKGAVFEQGGYIVTILSPLVTKTFNNEIEAARCAEDIVSLLNEHNKKFNDKINFGIGINSGEILNEIKDGKLNFTALGNTIIFAKRLADSSNKQILISKEAYEKGITEIKANKINVNGIECYEVKKVANYEKNKKFIDDFLKREGKGNASKTSGNRNYNAGNYKPLNSLANDSAKNPADNHNNNPHWNFGE